MDKYEITELLQTRLDMCESNSFSMLGHEDERMWEKPLVGFASGNDPLFQFFKEDIGEFYMTPQEVFRTKYADADAENLTVISLAFSHTSITKKEQALQADEQCLRWMLSRNTWKTFSGELYAHINNALSEQGIRFVIPDLMPEMKPALSEKYGRAFAWSQRHTAFVCGLGTFGLSKGLITRQGVAMRFASIAADIKIEPDKREYEGYRDWCLFGKDGSCGACIKRCPSGAITKERHDKEKCRAYLDKMNEKNIKNPLLDPSIEVGCGLCQSAVPCADKCPVQ